MCLCRETICEDLLDARLTCFARPAENQCAVYTYPVTNGVPMFEPYGNNGDPCPSTQAQLSTGSDRECDLQCAPGYSGSPRTLTCAINANDGDATTGVPVCSAYTCDVNNIANAVAHADYSSCDGLTTSATCTPVCDPGYFATAAASSMSLICDSNGDFNGANSLVCVENQCAVYTYPVTNGVPMLEPDDSNGDPCSASQAQLSTGSDPVCDLQCAPGYAGSPSTLTCATNANDGDATTGAPVCSAYTCDVNNIANAVTYADYSSCNGLATSATCTPGCDPGYRVTNAASSISLICDSNGDFDDVANSLVCTGTVCAMGREYGWSGA